MKFMLRYGVRSSVIPVIRPATLSVVAVALLATVACLGKAQSKDTEDPAKAVYAAPGGWSGGDGTKERPFDLGTAVSGMSPVRPGGTVWLRGGTYKGTFISVLTGTKDAPITVRPYPGEHVLIDGVTAKGSVLTINGAWTIFRDFEMTDSDERRSGPELVRQAAVDVHGPNTKVVNLVVHDLGSGLGLWSDAVDAEAYGNIIYYNGWVGQDRGHGHGIYTQNKTGLRLITDNVVFNQYAIGIHAYGSDEAFLDHIRLEGNIVFNNGFTAGDFNILLGGHRIATRPELIANVTYDHPGTGNNVGYAAGCQDLLMKDNYFVASTGGYAIDLVNCSGELKNNTIMGASRGIEGQTIVTVPELMARYPDNMFVAQPTKGAQVFVRPNRFEPGRAHVVVFNWEHSDQVSVDLSSVGLPVGSGFELSDVRNLAAGPIVSGAYAGRPVKIPMKNLPVAPVIGWKTLPPPTAPEFGVFLLTTSQSEPSAISTAFAKLRGFVGL
jgi:hypothetical protein